MKYKMLIFVQAVLDFSLPSPFLSSSFSFFRLINKVCSGTIWTIKGPIGFRSKENGQVLQVLSNTSRRQEHVDSIVRENPISRRKIGPLSRERIEQTIAGRLSRTLFISSEKTVYSININFFERALK